MKVAYLGIGAMGAGIAKNILKAGFDLSIWNRTQTEESLAWQNAVRLAGEGAVLCENWQDAVRDAEIVGMCLTNDQAVTEMCRDLLEELPPGTVVFHNSTISPGASREIAETYRDKGIGFLDAPVSGGPAGAEAGTLAVMVGGSPEDFEQAKPVLEAFSGTRRLMGPSGSGSVTKLINQMMTGMNQAVACEALYVARETGLDMENLYDILTNAWAKSEMFDRSFLDILKKGDFHTGAWLRNMAKDMGLIRKMVSEMGARLDVTEHTAARYQRAMEMGLSEEDIAAIIRVIELENALSE